MKVYPDKATFDAELDRLSGISVRLKIRVKKEGIESETARLRAAQAGEIIEEDAETGRLASGGDETPE